MKTSVNIFWFRRDLRLDDNAALYHALKSSLPVLPVFIFDRTILDLLEDKSDARVEFIFEKIRSISEKLHGLHTALDVYYGYPKEIFAGLLKKYQIGEVFINEDYEPTARQRDQEIEEMLQTWGAGLKVYKDQVIFSKEEILKKDGGPYTVFTPYSRAWKTKLQEDSYFLQSFPTDKYFSNFLIRDRSPLPDPMDIGFTFSGHRFPSAEIQESLIKRYAEVRDFPGKDATSHLGIHLRFGTISVRKLVKTASRFNPAFLEELIWREFYQMILWHFPKLGEGHAFKESYEKISWRNNEREFTAWCQGKTGYPLVDAGMRQLNETGYMHNRVRMVTASFLSKHLLIDWRWGEAYFAEKLLDFDFASNNGGWQWAAGCGCDAAPYFRIFNPTLQREKFDPDCSYITRWVPEFQELNYPPPIVEHGFARARAIRVYKEAVWKDR
jgi:deoxyribodipyrimidine photo-lyase